MSIYFFAFRFFAFGFTAALRRGLFDETGFLREGDFLSLALR